MRANAIVGNLFRDKYREILGALTREYGPARLDIIEDAIQEAMLKSLEVWSVGAIPANPGGWLFVTARRRVIDKLRASHRLSVRESAAAESVLDANPPTFNPLDDDVMKMIFICCHPELSWKTQVSLMLKNLCALGNAEIAAVLLSTPEAVKKTLTRAKRRIRELRLQFELPDDTSVDERLDAVLRCLYMMFNEGYLSYGSEQLTQRSLCHKAVQLVCLLARSSGLSEPGKVCALASLLSLQASRLPARTEPEGGLIRLHEQDRSLWDKKLIAQGMGYLELSTQSNERTTYHLQAAIAACHATSASYEDTDWIAILGYYDELLEKTASPIVALNRTVAVAMTEGYAPALGALKKLEAAGALRSYYLLPALKAEYQRKLGAAENAVADYRSALRLVGDAASRRFLQDRLAECIFDD